MGQSIVIHGLIKKRAEVAGLHRVAVKAADSIKDDLAAIDRALHLCGYGTSPGLWRKDQRKKVNKLK